MQFLLAGYKSGKDGETIVPLDASVRPPQASGIFQNKDKEDFNRQVCLTIQCVYHGFGQAWLWWYVFRLKPIFATVLAAATNK